jgi:hypothetical protein
MDATCGASGLDWLVSQVGWSAGLKYRNRQMRECLDGHECMVSRIGCSAELCHCLVHRNSRKQQVPDLALIRLSGSLSVVGVAVVVMSRRVRVLVHKTRRKLVRAKFKQKSAAWSGGHIAQWRQGAKYQACQQGNNRHLLDSGIQHHILQLTGPGGAAKSGKYLQDLKTNHASHQCHVTVKDEINPRLTRSMLPIRVCQRHSLMSENSPRSPQLVVLIGVLFLLGACGGGGSSPPPETAAGWLIPISEVVDGGPGKDGIPAIDRPLYESAMMISTVADDMRVVVVRRGTQVYAYPRDVMDYHEVVNDGPADDSFTVSYCPLTASSVGWNVSASLTRKSFGVSGLLYNNNVILYDRETDSNWSQMLQQSVNGERMRERPEKFQVLEMAFSTLKAAYPDAMVMTRETTYDRDYDVDPYIHYTANEGLLYPVSFVDGRLFLKARVLGIRSGTVSRVYQVESFGPLTQTINDQFEDQSIVVVGNTDLDIAVIYSRVLADGTILSFSPLENALPNIMTDTEGNVWDVFGTAVSGPRAGEQLAMTESYVAMWFAWAAFFRDPEIYFN